MRWVMALLLFPALASADEVAVGGVGQVLRAQTLLGEPSFALECLLTANPNCAAATGSTTIATTRASPVPCEVGGTWTTLGNNVACVGPRGLESWPQATNYATNSTNIGLFSVSGGTLTQNGDGSYRLTDSDAAGSAIISAASNAAVAVGETWTTAFEMRRVSGSPTQMRIAVGGSSVGGAYCTVTITDTWTRPSCTQTTTLASDVRARLAFGPDSAATGSVDIRQAQLEKSSTPGRRCDAGATATTCQADQHTVSTAGWPNAGGEIRAQATPRWTTPTEALTYLLDSRPSAGGSGTALYVQQSNGALCVASNNAGAQTAICGSALAWVSGTTYAIRYRWSGSNIEVWRDGASVLSSAAAQSLVAHSATAAVASRANGTGQFAGSVKLLSVSAP